MQSSAAAALLVANTYSRCSLVSPCLQHLVPKPPKNGRAERLDWAIKMLADAHKQEEAARNAAREAAAVRLGKHRMGAALLTAGGAGGGAGAGAGAGAGGIVVGSGAKDIGKAPIDEDIMKRARSTGFMSEQLSVAFVKRKDHAKEAARRKQRQARAAAAADTTG